MRKPAIWVKIAMPLKKVSVSIVNYCGRELLAECLASVGRQTYPSLETVVVDNASDDGSVEFVRESFPWARVIENGRNELFCKAQNTGIGSTSGEYVLILNNDVVLHEDFVAEAVKAIEADPKVGAVTGKILRMDGRTLDTTGLFRGRDRRPVERGYGRPDEGRFEAPEYVFGTGGVCPLYRRECLDDASPDGEYFDPGYGAFYEDLDLAWRAQRKGWRAYYAPKAIAWHHRGATAQKKVAGKRSERDKGGMFSGFAYARLPDFLKARLLLNRYKTMIRNDRLPEFFRDLPWILLYDLKLWGYTLLFSPRALPGFIKGLPGLAAAWRRRREFNGN